MAVSAYTSLVSLTHVLDNVHYRAHHRRLHVDLLQIEALQDKVCSLLDFVEAHSQLQGENITGLWRQISEVAFEADQTFDSHVVKQLLCQSEGEQSSSDMISAFYEDLDGLIQKIDFIHQEFSAAVTAEGVELDALVQKLSISSGVSHPTASGGQDTLVGFDEHVVRVMDKLTSDQKKLQIIPIVGMGGIGKTTLTRHLYDQSYILDHFDLRFWLTISQDYSVQNIIQGLLGVDKDSGMSLAELGTKLHKTLYGRRYLIVMDDVWTAEPCENLMMYFPDNRNGSRILITTRLLDVATCLGCRDPYLINFLNEDQSWILFCQKVFSQNCCPHPELEDIGKDMAKSCRGLPLAIIAIGRQLARSKMDPLYWKSVCENIYSFGNLRDDDHCFKILSLSYNSLPLHLKPCFLYLRVFPEDSKIGAQKLIRLLVDEGFIRQRGDKSQEDLAREYVEDLIDRNLVFVRERIVGEVRSCAIHDLFRELCIRESDKEDFLYTPRIQCLFRYFVLRFCSLCGHRKRITKEEATDVSEIVIIPSSSSEDSTYFCDKCWTRYSHIRRLKLVRVMDYCGIDPDFDARLVHPTGIRNVSVEGYEMGRYLKFANPSMLSILWNLNTLILNLYNGRDLTVLPSEIWDMPQLQQLESRCGILPLPVVGYVEGNGIMIMKNLQRLDIKFMSMSTEVVLRIQNLKILELKCCNIGGSEDCQECSVLNNDCSLTNLVQLHKLQALSVCICRIDNISFPSSLTKLSLVTLEIPSKTMTIIGSLPNLEVLMLYYIRNWVEWRTVEGHFPRLKELHNERTDLEYWEVEPAHFPNLEWLHLGQYNNFQIPLAIGDIPTLRLIVVVGFGNSLLCSARELWEEQQSYGNESLQIQINGKWLSERDCAGSGCASSKMKTMWL